mgnify:FL=1
MLNIIDSYFASRDVSVDYKKNFRKSIELYVRLHGDDWSKLDREQFAKFADQVRQRCKSVRTANTQLAHLKTLWHFAADLGLAARPPRRLKRFKEPQIDPQGWTVEEFGRILKETAQTPVYWRASVIAALWLAWNTGLRRGDIRTLHRHQITSAGLLVHVMSKTGVVVRRQLWPETLAAIEGIAGPDALIIPPCDWKKLNREIKAACKRAHVQVGTVKFARKGSASEVERSTPGQGYRFLGHTKPGVFDAYYRVDRICGHCVPQPPRPSSFK